MSALTIFVGLIAVALGAIAVKFDFNRWLEYRREARRERARDLCPHVDFEAVEGGSSLEVRSLVVSPPGTSRWYCQRCGTQFLGGRRQAEVILAQWASDPEGWLRRQKKIARIMKRL